MGKVGVDKGMHEKVSARMRQNSHAQTPKICSSSNKTPSYTMQLFQFMITAGFYSKAKICLKIEQKFHL